MTSTFAARYSLSFFAVFHTDFVVSFTCGLRMSLCARALKVATVLAAGVCRLRGRQRDRASGQREHEDNRDFHKVLS